MRNRENSVALRKESVDRNALSLLIYRQKYGVALRKESVDRNTWQVCVACRVDLSLSARRAWIEIVITAMTSQISVVALRKESVDRNLPVAGFRITLGGSLSARRAWIEIAIVNIAISFFMGRSPQGERG